MPDQNIIKFFREGLAQGMAKERLFDLLRKEGWDDADIQEAYNQVSTEQSPGRTKASISEDRGKEFGMILEKLEALDNKLSSQGERIEKLEHQSTVYAEKRVPGAVAPSRQDHAAEMPPPPPKFIAGEAEGKPAGKGEKMLGVIETEGFDFERIFGGNWMVKIGVAALVLGMGFFLKLAFDNGWIGPTGQIIIGMLSGFALMGAGEYWQKRYPMYAQILTGGGIAILYFTTYAAYAFYEMIGQYLAFGFMSVVTLISGILAIRYEKPTIAVIGILGGFFTPFMFIKTVSEHTLLVYTLVLDAGILLISSLRNWRPLTLIGLIGSFALYLFWHIQFYSVDKLATAEIFLTSVFLIFAFATILWHLIWKKKAAESDLVLMSLNATIYVVASYLLLSGHPVYKDWVGFFTFSVAAIYVMLAYIAFSRAKKDFRLTLFLGAIALVLLTIAMPMQLDGKWITIAWAIEGLTLIGLGFYLLSYHLRMGGLLVFILTGVRLIFFDTAMPRGSDFTLLFNTRFLTFIICIGAFFLAAYLYHRARGAITSAERRVLPVLLLAGTFFTLWTLTAEVISFFDEKIRELRSIPLQRDLIFDQVRKSDYGVIRNLEHAKNFSISALWAVYSIALISIGIFKRTRVIRVAGLSLFLLTILKVFVVDVFGMGGIYRVASLISLGIVLTLAGYLYQRYGERIKEFMKSGEGK